MISHASKALAAAVLLLWGTVGDAKVQCPSAIGPQGLNLCKASQPDFGVLLRLTYSGTGPYTVDANTDFDKWYEPHSSLCCPDGKEFMDYFVRCAFPWGATVTATKKETWNGRYGLASGVLANPKGGMASDDDRFWVSACVLAHANAKHLVQHISLRGAHPGLALRAGEEFAMGYPEGVFFGNLWEGNPGSGGTRYAVSLNLPDGYDKAGTNWWPPNAALGRTFDFLPSPDSSNQGVVYLGRCRDGAFAPLASPPPTPAPPRRPEPVHATPWACAHGDYSANSGKCTEPPNTPYRPIFVYGPHFATVQTLFGNAVPSERVQFIGKVAKKDECNPARPWNKSGKQDRRSACVVGYDPLKPVKGSACAWESTATPNLPDRPDRTAQYVLLGKGVSVQAIRRVVNETPDADGSTSFTAIVRVMADSGHPKDGSLALSVSADDPAKPLDVTWGELAAKSTGGDHDLDKAFTWLEVYPVTLRNEPGTTTPSLGLTMTGQADKGGLRIDAVGFTPGPPWCCDGEKWCKGKTGLVAGLCHRVIP